MSVNRFMIMSAFQTPNGNSSALNFLYQESDRAWFQSRIRILAPKDLFFSE